MNKVIVAVAVFGLIGLVASQGVVDARCPATNSRPPTHLPHESDCQLYYLCHLGERHLMPSCAPRIWDQSSNSCIPGSCDGQQPPTTPPPGGEETTPPPGEETTPPPGEETTPPPGEETTPPPGEETTLPTAPPDAVPTAPVAVPTAPVTF